MGITTKMKAIQIKGRKTTKGNKMRLARCFNNALVPRFRHSIAVKNPLIKKNKGRRNPWIACNKNK